MRDRLEKALGARVAATATLPVGFGLTGLKVTLADGRVLAVKARESAARADLRLEAYMLDELARQSDLPVPRVHVAEADLLVMDFIDNDGGSITPSVERHAAELIANLHATPRPFFGYRARHADRSAAAAKPKVRSLAALLPRAAVARHGAASRRRRPSARGHACPHRAARRTGSTTICSSLRIRACCMAISGRGTCSCAADRIAGFVDPAIYYGHPEIELAFTTMFGTFGSAFFDAYAALLPLEPGFHELRSDLYNLYPTLVHVRLFGAGYLGGIDRTLSRLGF